jgi:hypothetical protein
MATDQTPSIEEIRARRAAYDRGTVSVYEILRDMDSLLSRVEADERRIKALEDAIRDYGDAPGPLRGESFRALMQTIGFNRPDDAASTPSTEERAE